MNNIFKTIYESATLLEDGRIVLDSKLSTHTFDAVEGKHCIWIPELELKIPWTYNGKIESRKQWELGINAAELLAQTFNDNQDGWDKHTLASIAEEYRILKMLAEYQMAPPTEGFIYIKNFISVYTRPAPHCDPMGMIGYHTKDANKLPGGKFSFELFEKMFTATSKIEASHRALGDLHKESNIVNGYLIDIRRTIWDMMRLGESLQCFSPLLPAGFHKPDPDELHDKIGRFGQFPYSRRRQNYQTYCMDGIYFKGSRDTVYRMEKMGVPKELKGKTVLDLGCQIGAMCAEAYMRGARHVTGIEHEKDYVECARDLARYNGHQINYMRMDLTDLSSIVSYVGAYYGSQPIDIVFLLSMYKHLGDVQFELLERLSWREAYVESNNCPDGYESGQARKMEEAMKKRIGWSVERLGLTTDRSPRCLWRLIKKDQNMDIYYILDNNFNPIMECDILKWACWMEKNDRKLADDNIGESHISTVFLGIDHNWRNLMENCAPPLLFETMIFGGKFDECQWRYSTKDEAVEGHKKAVELVYAQNLIKDL